MKIAVGSLFIGLLVFALKVLAWQMTGSVALLSDALESTVNMAAALAALIAIYVAQIPADENHPFGHHKAEYFSAALEGVLIILAALFILKEVYLNIAAPRPLEAPIEGLLVNGFASAINAFWAYVLLQQGKKLSSPALTADGKHLWADVITSVGVAFGVLLAITTGWWILDPIMAGLVAINILWSGSKVVRASLSSLLDEAVHEDLMDEIRAIITTNADGAVEAHDLRTRHAGSATFVEFHLVVPSEMSVYDAHEICDRVEAAIIAEVPSSQITIHIEPEHKAQNDGVMVM